MRPKVFQGLLGLLALPLGLSAAPIQFDLKPDRPVVAEGAASEVVLRLNVHAEAVNAQKRSPLNLCLVLDKSGSMSGAKIERLKEAALQAVGRLGHDDVLSIVAFSDGARVLLPATKLRERSDALAAVEAIQADGSTALHAGVHEGLAQAKKFMGSGRVSRILLLSDGLANVGPSSPAELAAVGREAGRLGIPVTTFGLGLGYGEDLMTQLAMASDGNHAFIPDEGGLQAFFDKELGEAFGVAARELVLKVTLAPGAKLKGSLDREVEQKGREVTWRLNQLPGGVDKRLLLEVEAPALKKGQSLALASAELSYADAEGKAQPRQSQEAKIEGGPAAQVEARLDKQVAGEAVAARANQQREKAISLMDAGKRSEAAQVLQQNASALRAAQAAYGISSLGASADAYSSEAASMTAPEEDTNSLRKSLKAKNYQEKTQQSY